MKFDEIRNHLRGIPHTPPEDGEILYNFILSNKPKNILELGFQHGVSTNYIAAALEELKSGRITTIDREVSRSEKPNIYELSERTGLDKFINPIFARSSYIWELRKLLKYNLQNPNNKITFDFCFIDGAHSFEVDGFAFYLVDLLLNENGIILFDDIDWSYAKSPTLKNEDFVKSMSEEERNAEQIRDVLELLVSTNPNYQILEIKNRWAWVQKTKEISNNNIDELYKRQSTIYQIKNLIRTLIK